MGIIHLNSIISKHHESFVSRVLLHQWPTVAPSLAQHIVLRMRYQTLREIFVEAAGSKVSKERFESESAAAYESGVYLEDPIEMSISRRARQRKGKPTSRACSCHHTMLCRLRSIYEVGRRNGQRQRWRLYGEDEIHAMRRWRGRWMLT